MILVWDNLIGHHSGNIVLWLYQHGIMPLFTPIKGSWLNMRAGPTGRDGPVGAVYPKTRAGPLGAVLLKTVPFCPRQAESVQRIIVRRALDGTHPTSPTEIITSLERPGP